MFSSKVMEFRKFRDSSAISRYFSLFVSWYARNIASDSLLFE